MQRIWMWGRKQADTISNLSQHSWPTLTLPLPGLGKLHLNALIRIFTQKMSPLSIRAKHSQAILTLADICQLVKQGNDQILILEAGDSRIRDSGCKNGTSIGIEEN